MATRKNRGAPSSKTWVLMLSTVLLFVFFSYAVIDNKGDEISYTELRVLVETGKVARATVSGSDVYAELAPEKPGARPRRVHAFRVPGDDQLVRQLLDRDVKITGARDGSAFGSLLLGLGVLGILFVIFGRRWVDAVRGQGGLLATGKSHARVYVETEVKVTFADVAGVDEAKQELAEVIEFLRTPEKFRRLGGTLPKGILLVGPPGTGKTLLARAVAGEASVPFFSISGSEFVEMFVGVGAARVRDLFAQAKEKAPCIIFIDELDALGKVRGVGVNVHEEREQTLNQLLVELDGFDPREGVILMAATNRPEILDPALLRAGRFDRHVLVDRPDRIGRRAILDVHARKITLGADVDLDAIAGMTAGMVGADLANLVNEAALLAVRRNRDAVAQADFLEAIERVVAGLEKKSRVLSPREKDRVAHHELGHALVALSVPSADPVQKISVIPRGIAGLGYTLQRPVEDRFLATQTELEDRIAVLLGGRVAEELIYAETSTGAQDDLVKATEIACAMVKAFGMSPTIGTTSLDRERRLLLDAPAGRTSAEYSEATAREIDLEVRRIIDAQHERVLSLLESRLDVLRSAAQVLLERETLSGDELAAMVRAAAPRAKVAGAGR
jgi:cell division protease FtsH